jgi:hypothetical protein
MKAFFLLLLHASLFFLGCATPRPASHEESPEKLYSQICEIGAPIRSVQGTTLIKTHSKEVSGQFPANVIAISPDRLRLEVTNFLGGTEALITVEQGRYEVTGVRGKSNQSEVGYGTWGGIPLRWATDLFLGKVPCPSLTSASKLSLSPEGELIILVAEESNSGTSSQKFVYKLVRRDHRLWPEALLWEQQRPTTLKVEFKFDDPEQSTLSPKRWEATSSKGNVKIKWRDRNVSFFSTPLEAK